MFKTVAVAALLAVAGSQGLGAQDAKTVVANASRAIGADNLKSITYSGTASNANFGQTKNISGPLTLTPIANYTRSIDFNQPASRATGQVAPAFAGGPTAFNQNIAPAQANWTQQLEIWTTPWAFLKGAAAQTATLRSQRAGGKTYNVVTWSPPALKAPSGQPYSVTGFINDQNEVERVETRVEQPILGDMVVESIFTAYQTFGGVKVPTKITQKRGGQTTFEATITGAVANPANIAELVTPPPPAAPQAGRGGGPPAPPAVETQKLAEGVYRITGGYVALAIDMGDHMVVLEGPQNEARGLAIINAARQAIPGKPIRYVVNTHAHVDHASGLAPFVAEGVTIITQQNNKEFLEKALGAPRTLVGDNLAKAGKKPKVEGVSDKRILRGGARTIELYHVNDLAHTDGMLIVYLRNEKILYTADFNVAAPGQPITPQFAPWFATLAQNVDRLRLDYDTFITVHPPVPDRRLTRADIEALTKGAN